MIEKSINGFTFLTGKWPVYEDKPTVVFIHGAGDSSIFWKYQIEGLSDSFNIICIDLPGHGRSKESGMSSVTEYANAVDNFISEACIPHPVPCGLSMGGAIALQLLLEGQSDYKAGIVVNSGAKLKVMPMIFEMIENDFQGYVNSLGLFAASENTDPNKISYILEELSNADPSVISNDFMACNSFDVMDRLTEIEHPVLVMTAEDDKLTPPKYGGFLAESIRKSVHSHIEGAGHISPAEKPEEVNAEIRKFIDGLIF